MRTDAKVRKSPHLRSHRKDIAEVVARMRFLERGEHGATPVRARRTLPIGPTSTLGVWCGCSAQEGKADTGRPFASSTFGGGMPKKQ